MSPCERTPRVLPTFAVAVVARLPLATFSIGILVHVQHLTGSFAVAGAVAGALAIAQAVGGPLVGRVVDRRGQTLPLVTSAVVAAGALGLLAAAPRGTGVWVLVLLATTIGAATPPVGACLRTLIPVVVPDSGSVRRAYAVDAAATELTWVSGPPLVLLAVTLWSSTVSLAAVALLLLSATVLFAALPVSRQWRPAPETPHRTPPRSGALQSPAIRTLVLVLIGVGLVFGATEVAVTASAAGLGRDAAAGPLLGLWGVGSFVGGVAAARVGGGASTARGLAVLLTVLGLGHLLLAPAAGSVLSIGVLIAVAGAMIAPILATAYGMVDRAAPEGTVTEAFAWMATATAMGTSAGAALGGVTADAVGPAAAFLVAGAGALAAAALARRSTLASDPSTSPAAHVPPAMADPVTA